MNFRIIKAAATGPDRSVLLFRGDYTDSDETNVFVECYSNDDVPYQEKVKVANLRAAQSFIRDFSAQSATEFVSRMKDQLGNE